MSASDVTDKGTARPAMPSADPAYDLLIKNVRVVRPHGNAVHEADIAIAGGKFAQGRAGHRPGAGQQVYDGKGRLAFPGVVDAHMHSGIYSPLAEDAVSESRAAAQGGVTSSLNYFRTGQYYLNKGGPYAKFFPEVLKVSARAASTSITAITSRRWTATHIAEIPMLIEKHGVALLQDLHVLRLARPARPLRLPARLPDDRPGRALRLRALRVRDARRAGRAREVARARRRRSGCRCIARPPRS